MRPTSTFFTARGSSGTTLVLAALLLLALGCDAKWAAPTGVAKRVKAALKAARNERKLEEEEVCTSGQYVMGTCTANAVGGMETLVFSYYSDAECGTAMVDSGGGPSVQSMTMAQITAENEGSNPYTTCIRIDPQSPEDSEMYSCNGNGQVMYNYYSSSDCTGDLIDTENISDDCSCSGDDDDDDGPDDDDSPACLKCESPPESGNCEAADTMLADGGCAAACTASEDAFNQFTSFLNNPDNGVVWILECPQYTAAKTAVSTTAAPSPPSPTSGDSRAAMPAAVLALLVLVATALLF